jgi:AraC-like DNA-binding protein
LNEIADQVIVIRHWRPAAGLELSTGRLHVYRDLFHEHIKLVLTERTPWRVTRRGTSSAAQPGQLVALHAQDAHSGEPVPGAPLGPWRIMCFAPELLRDATGDPAPRFAEPALDDARLAVRFRALYAQLEQAGPGLAHDEAALRFAALLGSRADRRTAPPADRHRHALRAMLDYLGDRMGDDVRLADLSRLTGLSPYQLVRASTRQYGLTPHRIHMRLRLDRAMDLIGSGQALAEIAHTLGFSDQAHLTRRFKDNFGMTPGAYRRALNRTPPTP